MAGKTNATNATHTLQTNLGKATKDLLKLVFLFFVGIDVYKSKLNVAILMQGRIVKNFEVKNDARGHKKLGRLLQQITGYTSKHLLVCLESTSIYHLPIANYLSRQKIGIVWIENAAQISRSMGIS